MISRKTLILRMLFVAVIFVLIVLMGMPIRSFFQPIALVGVVGLTSISRWLTPKMLPAVSAMLASAIVCVLGLALVLACLSDATALASAFRIVVDSLLYGLIIAALMPFREGAR